jgi:hypothetical protein
MCAHIYINEHEIDVSLQSAPSLQQDGRNAPQQLVEAEKYITEPTSIILLFALLNQGVYTQNTIGVV